MVPPHILSVTFYIRFDQIGNKLQQPFRSQKHKFTRYKKCQHDVQHFWLSVWNNQIGKPQINWLFITALNCLLFHFHIFSVLWFSCYIPNNLLTYRCWKMNLFSALLYLLRLTLMKFKVCFDNISFLMFKNIIECPEETFKKCNYLFIW